MTLELTGIVGWIVSAIVSATALSIAVLGAFQVWNLFIMDFLLKRALTYVWGYRHFMRYLIYRKKFTAWYRQELEDEREAEEFKRHLENKRNSEQG